MISQHTVGSQAVQDINSLPKIAGVQIWKFQNICILLCICMLKCEFVFGCPIEGCKSDSCSLVGGTSTCKLCADGYFKQQNQHGCSLCTSHCTICTGWTECLSCQTGFFLEGSSISTCSPCLENCASCNSRAICSECSSGFILSTESSACESSSTSQQNTSKASGAASIGPIIGYVVSGVVLIACCAITIIHQRRKQKLEQDAKNDNKNNKLGQIAQVIPSTEPLESTTKIRSSLSGSNAILAKALGSGQTLNHAKLDQLMGSEQRGLKHEPQRQVTSSPQVIFSPNRASLRSRGHPLLGAELNGLLNSPQRMSLKQYSPMIGTASSTPGSLLTGEASIKIRSTRDTPLLTPKATPLSQVPKGLISPGFSPIPTKPTSSSPQQPKTLETTGLSAHDQFAEGSALKLFRIKRSEQ